MNAKPLDDVIWSALPMPAILVDDANCILQVNPSAEQFLVSSQKALSGVPIWERLETDILLTDALDKVRDDQAEWVVNELNVASRRRAPVQSTLQIAPVDEEEGTVLILITPRNIVDRLERAQSSKSAAKSAIGMAEMLAHEIKNPLAGITGAAQLLSMGLDAADLELTDLIVAESRRIVKLLDQVEQFGNLRPPERKAINLHDLLDRARRSAQVGFAAGVRLTEQYDPSLPATYADGDQLLQVFLNLLKNAAEAMERSGTGDEIRIRTFYDQTLRRRLDDGSGVGVPLQVEIIDNGPGLPSEIASDIFEPFVSGRDNGTGLGLALVSKIISEHDGLVAVDSSSAGTTFRISLPLAPKTSE